MAAPTAPWRGEGGGCGVDTVSFSLEKGGRSDTCCHMKEPREGVISEISQTQKDKHCAAPTGVRFTDRADGGSPGLGGRRQCLMGAVWKAEFWPRRSVAELQGLVRTPA